MYASIESSSLMSGKLTNKLYRGTLKIMSYKGGSKYGAKFNANVMIEKFDNIIGSMASVKAFVVGSM
jgi:hypothetical protein